MNDLYDIVIIGSGPAGMSAAKQAAQYAVKILLLDEQSKPGGQIYRDLSKVQKDSVLSRDESYQRGVDLIREFKDCSVDYVPEAAIWHLSQDGEVSYSRQGVTRMVQSRQVILATGAQERPLPIHGWTLPGVMTMGAAQILLKDSGIGVENAVFAGCGPLLYLAVHQYLEAGLPIKAVIDLTPHANYFQSLRYLSGALYGLDKVWQGLGWIRDIKKTGIPLIKGVRDVRILGEESVSAIEYQFANQWQRLECEQVLLHAGVVPHINISQVAGCDLIWSDQQACWNVDVDDWFHSSVPNIAVVGDAASIGGAIAAEYSGQLAALGALKRLGKLTEQDAEQLAQEPREARRKEMRVRPFLETLFKIPKHFRVPEDDDIVVCRCEEINAGTIREIIKFGCSGPNQLKSFSRCGMGLCQGRFCGLTVSQMMADELGKPVTEMGYFRLRSPIKPLPLDELVRMELMD